MPYERIGFSNQLADGTWAGLFDSVDTARRAARGASAAMNRAQIAVPVFVDRPERVPRPVVTLATTGERVRYLPARGVYAVGAGATMREWTRVVDVVRTLAVLDTEVDALQALPADTVAWVAAGGTD